MKAEQNIAIYESIRRGNYWGKVTTESDEYEQLKTRRSQSLAVRTPSSVISKKGSTTSSWITTFRNELQAFTSELSVYEMATKRADEAVARLSARQQYLQALLESGKGTMTTYIELEKTRADTVDALKEHQQRLHEEANAYRVALVELNAKQANLNSSLHVGRSQNRITQMQQKPSGRK